MLLRDCIHVTLSELHDSIFKGTAQLVTQVQEGAC